MKQQIVRTQMNRSRLMALPLNLMGGHQVATDDSP